jgi:hypothetical protein
VLRDDGGHLSPVQWKSYLAGVQCYQGEVAEKDAVQRRFRVKVAAARAGGGPLPGQDWTGPESILEVIVRAHRAPLE